MKIRDKLLMALLAAVLVACSATQPYISERVESGNQVVASPDSKLIYSVFLVGDGGEATKEPPEPALELLRRKSEEAGKRSAVVFLGDNIYPDGLPPADHRNRKEAEERLTAQLDAVKGHPGEIFVVPGNHDWNSSRKGGLEALKRQEEFVESYLDRGNTFLPDNGFPGPVDIKLVDDEETAFGKDIRLIIIDTEWWLTKHTKPFGDTGEYDLQDAGDFLVELKNVMTDRINDHVLVAAHHPLFSNGTHGGRFPLRTHLSPPVFGTMYVLYRKFFGHPQDISHYRYQELKRELTSVFSENTNMIYASGHAHNLQYFNNTGKRMDQHFLVSGSVSKVDYAARGMGADFVYQGPGLMVVRYYEDGSSWMEAWSPDDTNPEGRLLLKKQLVAPLEDPFYNVNVDRDSLSGPYPDYSDSIVTVAANPEYDEPGSLHRALLGSHNREFWSIPVEVPVFDISSVEGGLDAVKLGGRGQSNTLRLQNSEGNDFVLRSVDKVAGKTWDEQLKNTLAHDLAQDQFSIINPYGAFILPRLADAAGIYHTNPRLYYIPDDPRLGVFANQAGGELALFEERPDNDMSHAPHFGGSEEVISTRDMLLKVEGDLDHRVDQRLMVRNRLFDMWISDWDRHEDQWRWASFEPFELDSTLEGDARKEGKIYRPIPRDRDVAFMMMDGIIPSLGKLTAFKTYQDFRESYGELKGLTRNSLALTRRFTNEVSREEWMSIARELKNTLTDRIIEEAVTKLPEPVYKEKGDRMVELMKIRRDKLPEVAEEYFELITRVVDVVGSLKDEYVEVTLLNGEQTEVKVYKRDDRDKAYYRRIFTSSETDEIRIYGLGGDDEFEIKGGSGSNTTIRIIGGSGTDSYKTQALSSESRTPIKLYDTADGNKWNEVDEVDIKLSDKTDHNSYDYANGFGYNTADPLLFFGHNKDDGLFVGGGVQLSINGFRKYPYAAIHKFRANVAGRTGAFHFQYAGQYTGLAGEWDGTLDVSAQTPNSVRNFLGFGNETREIIDDDDYYRARLLQYRVAAGFQRGLSTGLTLSAAPFFQVTEVREDDGRFITQPQAGVSPNTFEDQWYAGFRTELLLSDLDNEINPKQGFQWNNSAEVNFGIKNTSDDHSTLGSSLSLFVSPSLNPQLTLATRVGVTHNIGEFPFYKANLLGGTQNLRGLRSSRYNGRTNFYNNIELRGKLFDFSNYLLGGEFGLLGFMDHGRVWTDGERSDAWHIGYGGGAWMSLFKMTVIRGSIGFSEDEWNVLVGAGFFF